MRTTSTTSALRLDPARCDGTGICAHLAPHVIELDRWGYPLVPAGPLSPGDEAEARRAVKGCPAQALFLERRAAE
ncbi:MAG: ferredoxin [bacterium]